MPDLINSIFEASGGFFVLLSVEQLWRQKEVKGVSWIAVAFFSVWGFWNLFYYSHLQQWMSLTGGIWLVTINTVWVVMLWYYGKYPGGRDAS